MDSLRHFGVLGMKWGKRKGPRVDNSSNDSKVASGLKKKRLNEMTNDEIKTLTTRLQLEKQYKDLNKREVSAGQKFVNNILLQSATSAITPYITKILAKGTGDILRSIFKKADDIKANMR